MKIIIGRHNKNRTVLLYTGVTNNLKDRLRFHKENTNLYSKAFMSKYKCFYLLYYERFQFVKDAISREK